MFFVLAVGLLGLGSRMMVAQDAAPVAATPPVAPAATRTVEAPVEGLVRKDSYTVALTLPDKHELLVQGFEFEGETVSTDKLHFKQLAPGVVEITSRRVFGWGLAVSRGRLGELLRAWRTLQHAESCTHGGDELVAGQRYCEGIDRRTSRFRSL